MARHGYIFCRLLLCLALLLPMLMSLAGCQNTIKVSDTNLTMLQYPQLDELLRNDTKNHVVLVDVRNAKAFDQGHIPGAINIFLSDLTANDPRLAKARYIIVYSGGWTDPLSRAAGKRLMAVGYKGVSDFRGGVEAWQAEGRMLAVNRTPSTSPSQP